MTAFAWIAIAIILGLLCLLTVIQFRYAESLRLRSRDLGALGFFKGTLEARIGVSTEKGVLVFSLIKHTLVLLLGSCFLAAGMDDGGRHWQSFFEAVVFAWISMLAATYIFAQLLYRKTKGHWLLPFAPVLRLCALLVRPLAAILGFFESLVQLAEPGSVSPKLPNVPVDIEALITAGEEEGIIEKDDRKLIESVVAFGDKTVREVMTPRPKMVAIEANESLEDLRELVIHEQYSRIPVYERSIDTVIGFVHVRDMLELDGKDRHR